MTIIWKGHAKPDDPIYKMGLVVSVQNVKPSTSQTDALAAARSHLIAAGIERVDDYWSQAKVTDEQPPGLHQTWDEPAWYVWIPPQIDGDPPGLRSSRIIVVSKVTGRVIGTGSAGDEG